MLLGKNHKWWDGELEDRERVSRLEQALQVIKDSDHERVGMAVQNARLYGENTVFGYELNALPTRNRLTMNLIKSVVDSVVARITKNKPRPQYTTSRGNRSLRRKAKNLTAFTDYAMEKGKAGNAFRDAFLDAAVMGTGFVYAYRQDTEICFERIFPSEVIIDQQEGLYKTPQTMYRRKWMSKDTLIAMYPGEEGGIRNSGGPSPSVHEFQMHNREDLVEVTEAWKLPTQKGKADGWHVIATDKVILASNKWVHDEFPIITIRYNQPLFGYWGRGIAENLTGLQVELNKNLIKRQKILDLMAVPRVYYQNRAPNRSKMDNQIGGVYQGEKPLIYAPRTLPPELDAYIENLWQKGHVLEGISPTEAMGSIPGGLTSGVAVREYDNIVDGKFAMAHQGYQDAWMEGAVWVRKLGDEIHKAFPKWTPVAAHDRYSVETVDWDSLVEKDCYVLRAMPASSLPTHPGAKQGKVIELLQAGIIADVELARRLIDFPDLEEAMSLDRAQADYFDWVAEQILDEGIVIAPEPFHDPKLALKRIQAEYNRASTQDVPEDRLALLREYIGNLMDQIKAAQAEQAQVLAPRATGSGPATGFDGAPPQALQQGETL